MKHKCSLTQISTWAPAVWVLDKPLVNTRLRLSSVIHYNETMQELKTKMHFTQKEK